MNLEQTVVKGGKSESGTAIRGGIRRRRSWYEQWTMALLLTAVGITVRPAFSQNGNGGIFITFSAEKDTMVGAFPYEWKVLRGKGTTYTVKKESSGNVLHALSNSGNTTIIKRFNCSLNECSFLSWKWKAVKLPPGGNETEKRKNDSVAGIYVSFKSGLFFKALKYVWSTTLPKGTSTQSPYSSSVKIIVLESGQDTPGKWVFEQVNIKEDAKRYFGDGLTEINGLGIMTDSDNTESTAEAYYADIRLTHGENGSNPGSAASDK
jgi:hypothetical protein